MEQHQFKVSLSLGTKLLFSVVTLLLVVILFLTVSAVLVLKDDKTAYTYQSQATEALLAGREFVNLGKRALGTLKLGLASTDAAALRSVLENQNDIILAEVRLLDTNSFIYASGTPAARVSRPELQELQITEKETALSDEWLQAAKPDLLKNSFAMVNVSSVGKTPLLAVIVADRRQQSQAGRMPVIVGYVSLRSFGNEIRGSNITIANKEGWVLYSTDPAVLFARANISDDPLFDSSLRRTLSSGASEYTQNGTRYLGSYVLPGLDVVAISRTPWKKAMKASIALSEKFVLLGLMSVASGVLFAMFFAKTLTAPLFQLYQATREVAAGRFNLNLNVNSRDELGALGKSFNVMSHKIEELIKESMQKVHLENELAIASTVQQTLIPPSSFSDGNVTIRSHYQSASQCGGDWWGFFTAGNKLCIFIADATGHGLPCALVTAAARSCFSVMQKLAQEDPDFTFSPGAMLAFANRVVHDTTSGQIMMTFFAGVIDFDLKTLTYASAGHNPPWLFKKEGDRFTLKSLTAVGQRLGESNDVSPYAEKTIEIAPEDMLFLYTDGLMEGRNLEGEMFGKKRTRTIVESSLAGGPDKVIESLVAAFRDYNKEKALDDDVTLAVAKFLPALDKPHASV